LRPRIMPHGFASLAEAMADTRQHLAAVRRMFQAADVFVFTLGLTECWRSTLDGTVYPTCPGCGNAGDFDSSKYEFHNFSVAETSLHLSEAIALIRSYNPAIQIVLTVSPVPLIATMEPRHVLQATTYSKSVLRVTAEEMVRQHENVHYFASYEIITATRNTHRFIEDDGRTIAEQGVARAMELFFSHFTDDGKSDSSVAAATTSERLRTEEAPGAKSIVCDEEDFFRALAESHPRSH
jgi:hypothetical protein